MSEPRISRDDVAHLAGLARIDLSESELDRLGAELPSILGYVAEVQAVAGDDVEAMSHPIPVRNVFRPDVPTPSLAPADALAGAPASEDDKFLVPQILGED